MSNFDIVETSDLLARAGFLHGFSRSGVDFGPTRAPDAVDRDIARLGAAVGFEPSRCFQVKQVHGTATHVAEGDPARLRGVEGDALVARHVAVAVGVRVADCVPVLVGDVDHGVVAAVHAGWRGVEAGIVGVALDALRAPPRGDTRRVAAIGPSIGPCCFEVTVEIAEAIARAVGEPRVIVRRYGAGKAKVDLRAAVRAQLRAAGLRHEDIDDVGGCSVCARADTGEGAVARYHSYRRDGAESGRMLAVIVARPT